MTQNETLSDGEPPSAEDGATCGASLAASGVRHGPGEPPCVMAVVGDISERSRWESELRKSEEKYRRIVETANEGVWIVNEANQTTFANTRMATLLGSTPEDMIGRTMFDYMDEEQKLLAPRDAEQCRAGIAKQHDFKLQKLDGTTLWCSLQTTPLFNDNGQYEGALAMVTDISERKAAENLLRKSEERYRAISEAVPDLLFVISAEEVYLEFKAEHGIEPLVPRDQVIGQTLAQTMPPAIANDAMVAIGRALAEGTVEHIEYSLPFPDGTRAYEARISKCAEREVLVVVRDITERKRAEAHLQSTVREKEVLLKEIYHRVKNNLQVISSMIQLQSRAATDAHVRAQFADAASRVRSIALVHEQLYRSPDLAQLDFGNYLRRLVQQVGHAGTGNSSSIRVVASNEKVEIDAAIPCGLIVTELLSNCTKHAFLLGEGGDIVVSFKKLECGEFQIQVSDDGIGLPSGFCPEKATTLGVELILSLAKQLQGTATFESKNGTTVTLTFPSGT